MRREFPKSVKLAAWERSGGCCEECGQGFAGRTPHYDHVLPDYLGGEPTLENVKCLCQPCHRAKTRDQDRPAIDKSRRVSEKQAGARPRFKRPMPGSRASGWKQKIGGQWERR